MSRLAWASAILVLVLVGWVLSWTNVLEPGSSPSRGDILFPVLAVILAVVVARELRAEKR
jgi:hypothetical protein